MGNFVEGPTNRYFRDLLFDLRPLETLPHNYYLVCQNNKTFCLEAKTQGLFSKTCRCLKAKTGLSYDLRQNIYVLSSLIYAKLREAKASRHLPREQRHILADELLAARKVYKILVRVFSLLRVQANSPLLLECIEEAALLKEMPAPLLACRLGEFTLAHELLQNTKDTAPYDACLEFRERLLQISSPFVQVGLTLLRRTPDLSKIEIPGKWDWIVAALGANDEETCCRLIQPESTDEIKLLPNTWYANLDHQTLFLAAVNRGFITLVTLLLEKGHPAGYLQYAISKDNLPMAELLLTHGAACRDEEQQVITRLRQAREAQKVYTSPDHTLVVGTERIDVNKAVMASLSPVLDAMWKSAMKEGIEGSTETRLSADNPAAVKDCIGYLAGDYPLWQEEDINRLLDLLHQAEKLGFDRIGKAACSRLITLFNRIDMESLGDDGYQALADFKEHLECYQYLDFQEELQTLLQKKIGGLLATHMATVDFNTLKELLSVVQRLNSFLEKLYQHNLSELEIPDHVALAMRLFYFMAQRNDEKAVQSEIEKFVSNLLKLKADEPIFYYQFAALYGLRGLDRAQHKHAKDQLEALLTLESDHEKGVCAFAELILSGGAEDAPNPKEAQNRLDAFATNNSPSSLVKLVQAHIRKKMENSTPLDAAKIKELIPEADEIFKILPESQPETKFLPALIRAYLLDEEVPSLNTSEIRSKIEKHFIKREPINDNQSISDDPFFVMVFEPALYCLVEDAAMSYYNKYRA